MGKVKDFYQDEIMYQQRLNEIKEAFKDYVKSEGCSCCQDTEKHQIAQNKLGELLGFEKYPDGSGYNVYE